MFYKFTKPILGLSRLGCGLSRVFLVPRGSTLVGPPARSVWGIPPSQYDMKLPKKLQFGHVCREHWELIPVFAVTFFSGFLVVLAFVNAARNKVDIVFSTHSRNNISRTMDLRNPTIHKLITINQIAEPWPEMQDVLDRMLSEEQALMDAPFCAQPCARLLCARTPKHQIIRKAQMLPATQYDMARPVKLYLSYALSVYWELIPLFCVTSIALFLMFGSIVWACNNKVDVVFTTHNRENISRTMNLRLPKVYKLIVINQRYEPWPEMQDVLDKMASYEKRLKMKLDMCAISRSAA